MDKVVLGKSKVIRVIVVDDSVFMRKAIPSMLEKDPSIKVVETAKNGEEAIEKILKIKPDVVTLDIEMPKKDGIQTLREIMESKTPVPCIMVSSFTTEGAEITLNALELGAFDFIPKPSSALSLDISKIERELISKVHAATKINPKNLIRKKIPITKPLETSLFKKLTILKHPVTTEAVLIGISTGGPPALQKLLPQFPHDFPVGIVIAQHMPHGFTKPLAKRLDRISKINVKEAEEGDIISPGKVLIGKAGYHIVFKKKPSGEKVIHLIKCPETSLYCPCINVMFESAAKVFNKVVAVIMTGMGSDGKQGLKMLKKTRKDEATIIAESKKSCTIFGMPKAAIEAEVVDTIKPLDKIVEEIIKAI